ncbi:MAG: glycerol-3-phosphate dehydrogenase/oxidase [Myxococcota bacterium]|nr:glycerol-3-phosphate dehydrogenase/oxidase [Myxococcota bacterium]
MGQRTPSLERTEVDLLIIGGGITGAGAARDAARRGLTVVVADRDDIAGGTSSRSSKLVHGGLRYLEQGEVSLVFEAVAERRILQEIAPHLVQPLPFLLPVFEDSRRSLFTINIGMWLYDGLSLFRSPKFHTKLNAKKVLAVEPQLRSNGLKGAPVYYDCATDDARLTLETMLDAERAGAEIRTHTDVTRLVRENGRVVGAEMTDLLSGTTQTVRARAVLNATGPWSDETRSLDGGNGPARMRPTKGIHIVLDADRVPVNHAIVCLHPKDGRVFFTIPWGEQTYIGTTDTDFSGDPGEVAADAADIHYLLEATNDYFPAINVGPDDVIATWAGVRPLVSSENEGDESSVSREHLIATEPDGLITIAGGKLTTYRRMGAEVVDTIVDSLVQQGHSLTHLRSAETDLNPLPGAIGWPEGGSCDTVAELIAAVAPEHIGPRCAQLLANSYGMRGINVAELVAKNPSYATPLVAGRAEIEAQVIWAAREELAGTVSDVMVRRTQLFFRDRDQGLSAVDRVAELLGIELGWTDEQRAQYGAAYRAEVARSRAWRAD